MIETEQIMPVTMTRTEQEEICRELASQGPGSCFTEWGSGGSTVLWYANMRQDQQLISIENSAIWAQDVTAALDRYRQQNPRPGPDFDYRVYETVDDGATFTPEETYYKNYVEADFCWVNSAVFLVDGRVRIWVARTIFEHARNRRAVVYCHDYSYNTAYWDCLLDLYPRSETVSTPGTEYQMLKLYMQ